MPAKTVTVYVCDRCEGTEDVLVNLGQWTGVVIPTNDETSPTVGQQLLCPLCIGQAKKFMAGEAVLPLIPPN